MEIRVKVTEPIKLPSGGWVSTKIVGPSDNGRVLVELRGHSGIRSWCCAALTFPVHAINIEEKTILPGVYSIQEGKDRKGRIITRFYKSSEVAEYILFGIDGFIESEGSSGEYVDVVRASGYSRTGKHGDRYSLVAAKPGAVIAVEPYDYDPIYYRVTEDGTIQCIGDTDIILPPDEW
ncbi:hypothetical protein [Anaerocellum danielii]|uniref:Uncharacterized protein n=1 Tax=Anaerocellum danielii TaxID=1387557 RepID=A0ABZ0U1Q7_9FIRM|nr:hypothetical protein [Caldicellulosiruptor danielii]WPX08130.1 hypothetical protein SOJ16_001994 [Caldicellulosiruptor danielii]